MAFARHHPKWPVVGAVLLFVLIAVPACARTLDVGPDKQFKLPSEAAAAAKDGDRIVIAAGSYFDCAVLSANNLTVEGAGPDATAVLTDKSCGGKALLVITGNDVTIRNLTLTRARVPDQNGAGIRAEGHNLLVEGSKFINNQNGILAASVPDSTIIIRDSDFIRNGICNPSCAHGIYINGIKLLRVEHSRFFEQKTAHHIKSRAARTEIIGCDIRDGDNGTASYLIDVPNGGSLIVRDSTLEKGPKAENHYAAIRIGEEGVSQPTDEILIENNSFRNDGNFSTVFVANDTATEVRLSHNRISGSVEPLRGDGASD